MYPNLLGLKAVRKISSDDMAKAIGISRQSFNHKLKTGKFTVSECKVYVDMFGKPFDYLFATEESQK